ncbi:MULTISPECIES: M23 family metallopeptidase [Aphanothece]|uniref:M23 family metallopeptidase n=1 Tax=Aphanothece TaxID=1121 RepID=UPI003984C28C
MAPAHPRWVPVLLLLPLLPPLLGVATAGVEAAPLPEPPIPDSATGAVAGAGADAAPWSDALPPPAAGPPAAGGGGATAVPGPTRPERPAAIPAEVAVGDLAPEEPADGAGGAAQAPPRPWHYPLAVAASEQDPWGWRYSSARGAWRMHTGLDLIAPEGIAVLAVQAGRVQRVAEIDGYGLTVLIDHGSGWSSLYAHLSQATVAAGERLEAGQSLGLVGQSGNASTAHLHLELRRRQPRGLVAVDPTPLLPSPQDAAWRPPPGSPPARATAVMP